MEKLRPHGPLPFRFYNKHSLAPELRGTIHYFAALSRFITVVFGYTRMSSQSRAFETTLDETATPLRCPRIMTAQALVPWTPARLAGALVMTLVSVPALLLQPAINRRRA